MDNSEQSRYNIVTIKNISKDPFTIRYDESNPVNRYIYTMAPGEVRRLPMFIAQHAVKHLVDQVLNSMDILTSNRPKREEMTSKIVMAEESMRPERQLTPEQQAIEKIDEYNKPSDLEIHLKKVQQPAEVQLVDAPTPPTEPAPAQTDAPEEEFIGLKDEEPAGEPTQLVNEPTRETLYTYARRNLGLTFDTKTQKRLDAMSIEELVTEFDYEG